MANSDPPHDAPHVPAPHELDGVFQAARELLARGRLDEATSILERAADAAPAHPAAHRLLAHVANRRGDPAAALGHMQSAASRAPRDPEIRFELGCLRAHAGDLVAAAADFEQVVRERPELARAWLFLANAMAGTGRGQEAIAVLRRGHAALPRDLALRRALALQEFQSGWPADALPHLRELLALAPADTELRLRTGETLHRLGDQDDAVACFREGVAHAPGDAGLWLALGQALEDAGKGDEALDAYRRALALRPGWPFALACLLGLARDRAGAQEVSTAMSQLAASTAPGDGDRALLGYALGKVLAGRGDAAGAMRAWHAANAARRRGAGEPDPGEPARRVDAIIAAHAHAPPARASAAADDDRIVLVVGMPRSGTTLTEQILASHAQVHGCGELPELRMLAARIGEVPDGDDVAEAIRRYLAAATRRAPPDARRLVDKEPLNFLHLGLAARLFPRARVLWCRRDPRDVAVSIYGENFATAEPWATRLDTIGRFHLEHVRLMRHWQATLPLPILECSYEGLVADPEVHARRMVAFLGLDWDPACLDFHATQRAVQSPSRWQVREPLHGRSVGRWRAHADELGPLLEVLGSVGDGQLADSAQASTPSAWTSGA